MCVIDLALKLLLRPTTIILENILPSPTAFSALGSLLQSIMHTSKQTFLPKHHDYVPVLERLKWLLTVYDIKTYLCLLTFDVITCPICLGSSYYMIIT